MSAIGITSSICVREHHGVHAREKLASKQLLAYRERTTCGMAGAGRGALLLLARGLLRARQRATKEHLRLDLWVRYRMAHLHTHVPYTTHTCMHTIHTAFLIPFHPGARALMGMDEILGFGGQGSETTPSSEDIHPQLLTNAIRRRIAM